MPHGPEDATEHVAKNSSSKTESNASTHPMHQEEPPKGEQVQIQEHKATPGPVMPKDFDVQNESTKEERRAKTEAMNK